MDRAAWRRVRFSKVSVVAPGIVFHGTLQQLKDIVDYTSTHEQKTDFPGARRPYDEMRRNPDAVGHWRPTSIIKGLDA